jgi:hypothetical protein
LQPLLFGLIGNEIDLYFLDLRTVGLGVACLAVSLTVSNVASALALVVVVVLLVLLIEVIDSYYCYGKKYSDFQEICHTNRTNLK